MDVVLKPVRLATSKPARKTYLNTLLLTTTSAILLFLAALSYCIFYYNFIPQIGITRHVHLQFGCVGTCPQGPHPYAFIPLGKSLTSQQPYAIDITLILPRSPINKAAGNFMLNMHLLSSDHVPDIQNTAVADTPAHYSTLPSIPSSAIIFTSRRQALLAYQPPLITLAKQLFHLPLYLLNLRSRDVEHLSINMATSVSFPRARRAVAEGVYLEVQTTSLRKDVLPTIGEAAEIQIYECKLHISARLEGLRWIMYHHKLSSFILFTGAFWAAEVLFAVLTWLVLSRRFAGANVETDEGEKEKEKEEDEVELSDTPRTFPTLRGQMPLSFVPRVDVKEEGEGEVEIKREVGEADDEDEFGGEEERRWGGRSDSGLGTSFSEGGGSVSRRKGRRG